MLVVMEAAARPEQIEAVVRHIERMGFRAHPIPGAFRTAIGVTGHGGKADPLILENFPGVKEIIPVSHAYKLVSREAKPDDSIIAIGGVDVGGNGIVVIGGPCAVESLDQTRTVAERIKRAGGQLMRGGAYKPRTSPYSFQGLAGEGLDLLARAREETGLAIITEVVSAEDVERVSEVADILQVGARNMQNFRLLQRVGRADRPVFLKRGQSATLEEFLLAAEYVAAEGNPNVILCERGIRTFETSLRNTLDIAAVPMLKRLSHLPVVVDPSHATGRRELVPPLAAAALAAGADGVMVEVHPDPENALSDGPQSLTFPQFRDMMATLERLRTALRTQPVEV